MSELKTYTTEEVMDILKVSRRTLYRYIKGNQIKAIKLGKAYRFTEEAVRKFLEKGTDENYLNKLR